MPVALPQRRSRAVAPTKVVRYAAVTVINIFLGLATLVFLHGFLGWHGVPAAVTAVVASAVPCFLLNRRYVWVRAGRVRVRAEVLPFTLFTLLGLLASSVLVLAASRRYDSEVMIYVAHQSAFGILWVLRFLLFDRLLWRARPATVRSLPSRSFRTARSVEDLAA
ncbi:MAG: GtrA family protein [Acidimicrobiales bacterium]